ncbi:MAG: HD family phosphohydrolase [Chlamydiales bacterium]
MSEDHRAFKNEEDLKFSGEQGFFDKSKSVRYFIIALFGCSLFIFLHFRQATIEVLELNKVAPGFIVTQVDFDFPDDEATLILRQEAVRDIGKIYWISQSDIRQKRIEFDNFLLYNQAWYEQAESGTFDKLYRATDLMEKILMQMRMTDIRTLEKLKEEKQPTKDYYVYTPTTANDYVVLPPYIWDSMQKEYFSSDLYSPLVTALVIEFFKSAQWHIEEDIPAQKVLRKYVQGNVQEKMTHIKAGNRIINQGEKVTSRHLAMLQGMKNALGARRNLWHPMTLLGTLILTQLFVGMFLIYLQLYQPRLLASNRKLFLLVTIVVMTLGIAKLTEYFLLNSLNNLIETIRYPLFVPLAAILVCSLLNPAAAAFIIGFLTVVLTISLNFKWEGFLLLNLLSSFAAILSIHCLRRRKEIFVVCVKAWLCCVLVILALHLYSNTFKQFSIATDILSEGIFMLLTAVAIVGLLPLFESAFGIMTNVSLMEYMDPNNDLLRRLTIEAPGTYQHSIVVGNLAEAAALAIGANGLFCRVATLYHDVGKMATSQYFTENQLGEVNIHQLLTPEESAQVIMAHVPEGVAMAREAGLPEPIIDIIKEHHGTTLVYYFYHKQVEKMGGDKTKVDEREFRYAGPKPHSKESGIIMIADTFEAASRSLEKVNEETLSEMLDALVRIKIDDGQFNHCVLTFEELCIVKKKLVKTLLAAGHSRIKYPKQERAVLQTHLEEGI